MSKTIVKERRDDLTRITGIGKGVEARLNKAGILSYEQLAAQSPESLTGLLKDMIGFTTERIIKQDWIGQAQQLDAQLALAAEPDILEADSAPNQDDDLESAGPDRQHYETFTLELLLDADQNVRRTRVFHVQKGTPNSWAGWDEARLISFLSAQAEFPFTEKPTPEAVPVEVKIISKEKPAPPAPKLNLSDFQVLSMDTRAPTKLLPAERPFSVILMLDLSDVPDEQQTGLSYQAQVYARQLGHQNPTLVASMETESAKAAPDAGKIELIGSGLPVGIYRISADLTVHLSKPEAVDQVTLPLHSEGSLVNVL